MQDRLLATQQNLLRRTAGPYIWVNSAGSAVLRAGRLTPPKQISCVLDHLVGEVPKGDKPDSTNPYRQSRKVAPRDADITPETPPPVRRDLSPWWFWLWRLNRSSMPLTMRTFASRSKLDRFTVRCT